MDRRPKAEDKVTFLSSIPELAKREYTSYVFKLCCLCLGHVAPKLFSVTLGSLGNCTAGADLSDIIEPVRSYLWSSSAKQIVFTSAESISSCFEFLDEFADKAIEPCYYPWHSLDFHDESKIYADLTKAYKKVRAVSNLETSVEIILSPDNPDELAPKKHQSAQRPRIDVVKTSITAAAKALALKLCSDASGDCS